MEPFASAWTWIAANPAEAAWALFALVCTLVGVYRANETRIKEFVAASPSKADDRIVAAVDHVVAVFEVLRLFVPYLIAKPKKGPPDA